MSRTTQMALNIASRFFGKLNNVLVLALLTRTLSISDFGIYGIIFSLLLILVAVWDVGARNSIAYLVGKDGSSISKYIGCGYVIWLVGSFGCVLAINAITHYNIMPNIEFIGTIPICVTSISMLYIRIFQGVLFGAGDLSTYNRSEVIPRSILLISTIVLYLTNTLSLEASLWLLAISQAVGAGYLAYKIFHIVPYSSVQYAPLRAVLARGLPFMVSVVVMLASKRMVFLSITNLGTDDQAGIFFALQRFTEIMTEVGLAVSIVVFSNNVRADTPHVAIDNTAHSSRMLFCIFLVCCLAILPFSKFILLLGLGPKYAVHVELFRIMLFGTLFGVIWTVIQPAISAFTSPVIPMIASVIGLIINITVVGPMYKEFGLEGAALCNLISNLIMSFFLIFYLKFKFQAKILSFFVIRKDDISEIAAIFDKLRNRLRS